MWRPLYTSFYIIIQCVVRRIPLIEAYFSLFGVGVNDTESAEELFYRRFTIDEDFGNKNAIIEVHLRSIDMLVSVRADAVNKINSVTTTYLSGKTAKNEVST